MYIEEIITHMVLGETSECHIESKSGKNINFVCELLDIMKNSIYIELPANELYEAALKFKESGVKMFKRYPLFSQNYFTQSAKCIILLSTMHKDFDNKEEVNDLLKNVYLNLSACLLKQNRNEEVLHVLKSDDALLMKQEKAIYRKSYALYNLKRYDEAKNTLSLCNYKEKSEMISLWNKIIQDEKISNIHYASMVKKMFG